MGFAIAIVSSYSPTFTLPSWRSLQPSEPEDLASSLWADVGYATRAKLPTQMLNDGATLHAHVMAFNGVGLSVTASLTIVLDSTPPAFGAGALRLIGSGASDGERAGSFYVTGTVDSSCQRITCDRYPQFYHGHRPGGAQRAHGGARTAGRAARRFYQPHAQRCAAGVAQR